MIITFSQSKSLGVQKVSQAKLALIQSKKARPPFIKESTLSDFFSFKQVNTFFMYALKYFSNPGWSKEVSSYPKASTRSITFGRLLFFPASPQSSPAPPKALPQPISISSSVLTIILALTLLTAPSQSGTILQESERTSVPVKASVQSFIFNNQINIINLKSQSFKEPPLKKSKTELTGQWRIALAPVFYLTLGWWGLQENKNVENRNVRHLLEQIQIEDQENSDPLVEECVADWLRRQVDDRPWQQECFNEIKPDGQNGGTKCLICKLVEQSLRSILNL